MTPKTTADAEKNYIVTPIYYANGSPHIGHFLTTTVADVLARFYRKKFGGENVYFTTGLDEHGTAVEQSGFKEGYTAENLQDYVDNRAVEWKKAFDETNISYDYFVRTSNPKHKEFAQNFINKMVENGDAYKSTYKGKYCNGCEKFLTLSDQDDDGFCPLHRHDQVTIIEEDNYFFKLSKYAPKIKALIEKNEIKIVPKNKRSEMLARIDAGIDDLSISRPKGKVSWGVEFPGDSEQTVYVWVEALINYFSNLEINDKREFDKSVVHFLGKDINWFHNVIWPAFLLSAGYPLYKSSFVHSFLNISGQKISKSLGNVITPQDLTKKYGAGGTRYVTLANLPYNNDSDITWQLLDEKYNADLANGLGNAVARITKLAENSGFEFENTLVSPEIWYEDWAKPLDEFNTPLALQNIWKRLSVLDKHVNENEPWTIEDKSKLKEVLQHEIDELRTIAVIIEPFLPNTSEKLQKLLKGPKLKSGEILFPRV